MCVCLQLASQTIRSNVDIGVEDKARRTQSHWKWYHNTLWPQRTESFPCHSIWHTAGDLKGNMALRIKHFNNWWPMIRRNAMPGKCAHVYLNPNKNMVNMSLIKVFFYSLSGNNYCVLGTREVSGWSLSTRYKETVCKSGHGHWRLGIEAEIRLSHRFPYPLCRGVRPDGVQEVKGESNESIPIRHTFTYAARTMWRGTNWSADTVGKYLMVTSVCSRTGTTVVLSTDCHSDCTGYKPDYYCRKLQVAPAGETCWWIRLFCVVGF